MPTDADPPPPSDTAAAPLPPAGWGVEGQRWTRRAPAVLMTGVAVALLAAAVWAAASGERAAAVLLGASAVYVGHVAGLAVSAWWTPRRSARPGAGRRTGEDGSGIRYGYSRWPYYWLCAVLVLTALALAAVAVLAAPQSATGVAVAILVALLAVAVVWFLTAVLRLAPGEVTLSPEGVFHRSLTFTHFVPWYAVFDVTAEYAGTPLIVVKAHPSDGTRLRRLTGGVGTAEMQFLPYLVVRGPWLAADPAEVYRTLAFYAAHPDRRSELATGAPPGIAAPDAGLGA